MRDENYCDSYGGGVSCTEARERMNFDARDSLLARRFALRPPSPQSLVDLNDRDLPSPVSHFDILDYLSPPCTVRLSVG